MKICENCGMEYGDDNPFCPFCDERYGVVILADDVISADGLPAYKEEFPVIGETGVKLESFAANRDEIFERNTRLAEIENFMPKVEVKKVYKPVVPLVQVGSNGSIAPYVPSDPVVKNVRKNVNSKKAFDSIKKSLCVLVGVYLIYLFLIWGARLFGDIDNEKIYDDHDHHVETYIYTTYVYNEKTPVPNEITITSESGLEMHLTFEFKQKNSKYYKYKFNIINKTDTDLDNFYEEFVGLEYTDKFYYLVAHHLGIRECVNWIDGIPEASVSSTITSGEVVSGEIWLDFSGD